MSRGRFLLVVTCRALALYGFAAWVYVALVALIQPWTLKWQLTHLAKWPRTDTFGEISFVVSLVAFWCLMVLRQQDAEPPSTAVQHDRED
jgi:heme O synthase-like polyprenyltransferase